MTSPARIVARIGLALSAVLLSATHVHAQAIAADAPAPRPFAALKGAAAFKGAQAPITDVALSEDGLVRGRVLTGNGKPVDGAQVVIRRDEQLLHKLITDDQGQFSAKGLHAGVYTIATVQGGGLYRIWPKNIAPPSAQTQALLMTKEPIVRGQVGGSNLVDWAAIGIGAAGLTVGILTLDEVNNVKKDVEQTNEGIQDLQSP